ncbi:hypothetical protein [Paenibacillus sp. FSL W7-1287]|uniref:hypothetical protein n=1 Tax=Paenibacillus sp. FSL W7-1287 TaxID=2954538 RepID=UPI0030F76B63
MSHKNFWFLIIFSIIVLWHGSALVSYAAELQKIVNEATEQNEHVSYAADSRTQVTEAMEQQAPNVLLVYDSLAVGSAKEGNVDALKRLLGGMGAVVKIVDAERYVSGTMESYSHVILLRNHADWSYDTEELMQELAQYEGGYLHIGPGPTEQLATALNLELKAQLPITIRMKMDAFSDTITLDNDKLFVASSATKAHTYGSLQYGDESTDTSYGARQGRFAYIPFYYKGDMSEWAAGYVFNDWLNIEQQGHVYVLLTEVYPFSDLDMLRELSDRLYEAGIPFIVSTKPLFSNFDYPAAKRYVETLRYLQARNGSILIDAPAVADTISADLSVLTDNITSYIHFLAEHDVAPLGATAEMYWFQDQYYTAEGLDFYDSVIMLPNVKVMSNMPTDTLSAYSSSLYSINVDEWQTYARSQQVISTMPFNIALTLDMQEELDVLEQQLTWLTKSWTAYSDYKAGNHRVITDKDEIVAKQGRLRINGEAAVLQEAYDSISSEYVYIEKQEESLKQLFTVQNRIFIVLIAVVLVIFFVFIMIGYRMYRKKYMR